MSPLLVWAVNITLVLLVVGILFTVLRLLKGPSLADRIVSLDLVSALLIAFIAAFSIHNDDPMFMNVGLALGLIAFLSTVAFARYIGRRPIESEAETVPIRKSFSEWGGNKNE